MTPATVVALFLLAAPAELAALPADIETRANVCSDNDSRLCGLAIPFELWLLEDDEGRGTLSADANILTGD